MKTKPVKSNQRRLWATCDDCGQEIYYGEASVTFCRNIEGVNATAEHPDGIVTMVGSSVLVTLCRDCGDRFDDKRATEILKAAVNQPSHILN